jgi:hypothetical protein
MPLYAGTVKDQVYLERLINRKVKSLLTILKLDWLEVVNSFYRVLSDSDGQDDNDTMCEAKCEAWAYRRVTFRWNLGPLAASPEEDLDGYIIHELVHALTAPLVESFPSQDPPIATLLNTLNEMATENVAQAITAALQYNPTGGK